MKFTRCGLDIAKQVFEVHGVNEHGVAKGRKTLARAKVLEYFAQLPSCLIGIEACSGAHHWAREPTKLGHTVKLMAAQHVAAYHKRGKNDANDAEGDLRGGWPAEHALRGDHERGAAAVVLNSCARTAGLSSTQTSPMKDRRSPSAIVPTSLPGARRHL